MQIFIKNFDISHRTFIDGERLSPKGFESELYELRLDESMGIHPCAESSGLFQLAVDRKWYGVIGSRIYRSTTMSYSVLWSCGEEESHDGDIMVSFPRKVQDQLLKMRFSEVVTTG